MCGLQYVIQCPALVNLYFKDSDIIFFSIKPFGLDIAALKKKQLQ